jgi:hypothetical protein
MRVSVSLGKVGVGPCGSVASRPLGRRGRVLGNGGPAAHENPHEQKCGFGTDHHARHYINGSAPRRTHERRSARLRRSPLIKLAGPRFLADANHRLQLFVKAPERLGLLEVGLSYRVQADLNGSAVVILVRNAKNALLTMKELAELGYSEILTSDLDGQLVDRARLESEVDAP